MNQQFTKKKIASTLIIGMITTMLISFTLIAVNVGFIMNFLTIWFRSWCISFSMAVFIMLVIAPRVESALNSIIK